MNVYEGSLVATGLRFAVWVTVLSLMAGVIATRADDTKRKPGGDDFFESRVRPVLVEHEAEVRFEAAGLNPRKVVSQDRELRRAEHGDKLTNRDDERNTDSSGTD